MLRVKNWKYESYFHIDRASERQYWNIDLKSPHNATDVSICKILDAARRDKRQKEEHIFPP